MQTLVRSLVVLFAYAGLIACNEDQSDELGPPTITGEDAGPISSPEDLGEPPDEPGRIQIEHSGIRLSEGAKIPFGMILVGSGGVSFGIDVMNMGVGPLRLEVPVFEGEARDEYEIVPSGELEIPKGEGRTYLLRFRPTATSTRSAELRLSSNDPDNPLFTLSLEGHGAQPLDLVPEANGNWDEPEVSLYNTREARVAARVGDIDNLGFGWREGYSPFSGERASAHTYPFSPRTEDPLGTDHIMVVSSYDGHSSRGEDGYANTTSRPNNLPAPITLRFDLRGSQPYSAALQLFVDGIEPNTWGTRYQAQLDGQRWPQLERILNLLNQGDAIGQLITVPLSSEQLPMLWDGELEIFIDDPVTGAGDGFAVDFVKIYIDRYLFLHSGTLEGVIRDAETGEPVAGASISASGLVQAMTDGSGAFRLEEVPAGLIYITAERDGYASTGQLLEIRAHTTAGWSPPLSRQ